MKIYFPRISRITSTLMVLVFVLSANASNRPNVIILLTDDQGYGDLSCHGNPVINTPNIDQLHAESVRFTDFHVDPTCAPTRAALMTGKYSHHAGVWHTVCGGNHLRDTEVTMANMFKESGYRTGIFGKWHLGSNYPYRPMDRGFDEWLGHGDGGTGTTDDWFYNDRVNDHYWHNGERVQIDGYAPDVFYNAAIDFINDDKESDKPFFVYLPTYLPHHPHTIPDQSMVDKYKGVISDYVAYFFAGIDRIDQNIGKLRDALQSAGKADNTIIMFMTDNGGTAGVKLYNAGMRGKKTQAYEGGHRVPLFMHWPQGKIAHGKDIKELTAHIDILPTLVDICDLSKPKKTSFDGRSFKQQLYQPNNTIDERILFVENQRTKIAQAWWQTAGMYKNWRLIDNKELYNLSTDPAQKNNIIEQHPKIVQKIREAHHEYWKLVSPNDRQLPKHIIGHPLDKETFLTTSDWYLDKTPWNHALVANGSSTVGSWEITVAKSGTYRFVLSRWPREANTPICGVPTFNTTVDAWTVDGPVEKLVYRNKMKALPVDKIKLEVGKNVSSKAVRNTDTAISFDIELKKGDTTIKGLMLNKQGEVIAGTYYVYVSKI